MPSAMKSLALVAALAGAAAAKAEEKKPAPVENWEGWPTTTKGPDCSPTYEPYVCEDEEGKDYTTTYTIYSKGCPGYTSWAEWPPKNVKATDWESYDPPKETSTWETYDPPKSTWASYDPPKPTWGVYDPKPTSTWESYDPKPTSWYGWDGKPKKPEWPAYLGPKPDGWDEWKYVPYKEDPPKGWYEWKDDKDPKPANWDDWKHKPSMGAPPPGWFEWEAGKGPKPDGWDDWKYIIVVPVWPEDKGDKPMGWDDWKYVPYKPAPPPGWFEWDDGKDGKPANWDDWKYVPAPVWPDFKGDKPMGWDDWKYDHSKPAPPPSWFEWDDEKDGKDKMPENWEDWKYVEPVTTVYGKDWNKWDGKVITITFVETYKVPCSTGWAEETTTVYYDHCGCTETPKPEHPAYTTIVKDDCPDSWGLGKTVTYSTPVAAETTWSTWAKAAETTTSSWGVWKTSAMPVKPTESAQWNNVAEWKGAASAAGVSKVMIAAAGAVAGLALFL